MLRAKFSADGSKRENSDDVMGWNILAGAGVTTALKIVQWATTSGGQPHQTTEKTVRMFLCHHALFSHNTQFLYSKLLASSWGGCLGGIHCGDWCRYRMQLQSRKKSGVNSKHKAW